MEVYFERHLNPLRLAIAYSILSFASSFLATNFEDTLLYEQIVDYQGKVHVIHPFVNNYSTLIDFAFLNPLVLYYLIKSYQGLDQFRTRRSKRKVLTSYHAIGFLGLSVVLTISFMWFYFKGFLEGDYYDSLVMPVNGVVKITISGWIVFFWTSVFMCCILFFSFLQFNHLRFISQLQVNDIHYEPKHIDNAGGQKVLILPLLNYFYATIVMAMIFMIFEIYDNQGIQESNRSYGLIVFVLIALPTLILPILHLRRLMKEHRDVYRKTMSKKLNKVLKKFKSPKNRLSMNDVQAEMIYFHYVDKYQLLVKGLPAWPIPKLDFSVPLISLSLAILKILFDLLKSFS